MNYPYAVGTIKAIENNLFDKPKYAKLIKTEKSDFLKTLIDFGYGTNPDSLEDLIDSELLTVKKMLDEITPNKKYTDLFFLSSDALNIKAFYKIKNFGIRYLDIFVEGGVLSKESLKEAIYNDDYSLLPKEYQKLLKSIKEKVENENNPRLVSAKIDNSVFEFVFQRIGKSDEDALSVYYQAYIDFANILTLLRSRALKWSYSNFKDMFLSNGKIDEEVFKNAFELNNEAISRTFKDYYSDKVQKGLKLYYEKMDLNQTERYFDRLLLEVVGEFKNDSFSIGPIIYYYLRKQAEAKNIRVIYASTEFTISDLLE